MLTASVEWLDPQWFRCTYLYSQMHTDYFNGTHGFLCISHRMACTDLVKNEVVGDSDGNCYWGLPIAFGHD